MLEDVVLARPAADHVPTLDALHVVVARAQIDHVVAVADLDPVVAGPGAHLVVATRADRCPAEAEPAVVVRGDLVVARPGPDGVVAGSATHADRELGAAHLVVAGAEHQPHRAYDDPVAAGADRGSRPQVDRDAVGGAAEAHHVDPE